MYVVRTSKTLHEETPNVNIQFQPHEMNNEIGSEEKYDTNKIISGTTESPFPTTYYELGEGKSGLQDRGTVSLLKNLNLPKYKAVPNTTDKSREQLPQNVSLEDTGIAATKVYNIPTMFDQSQNIQTATASDVPVDSVLQNSVEKVFNSSTKEDSSATSSDVYHIIELSSNEEAHFDPSSYESIVYVQQVPLESVETSISEQYIGKEINIRQPSVEVHADRKVGMYTESGTSKYDSSKSKVSTLQKYTPEDIASMGKTPTDLIYNYPGRKFPFKPKQSSMPAAEEKSPKLLKQEEECEISTDDPSGKTTQEFVKPEEKTFSSESFENSRFSLKPAGIENSLESSDNAKESNKPTDKGDSLEGLEQDEFVDDEGDCSGCEETELAIVENEDSGKQGSSTSSVSKDLVKEADRSGIDKWSHDLGLRRIDVNKIPGKTGSDSNILTPHRESKRIKNSKRKQVNYKSVIQKGGKDYLNNVRKQLNNNDSNDETTNMDIEKNYWKDVCKCYHYANKSVIKISPLLQSMIKDRVCVIELEVEDSLKVGSVQRIGGAYGKELYYLTIENPLEEEKLSNTKSNSKKKSSKVSKLKPAKSKTKSKTTKRKISRNVKSDGTEQDVEDTAELDNIPVKRSRLSDGETNLSKPKDLVSNEELDDEIDEVTNDNRSSEVFKNDGENASLDDITIKLEEKQNEVSSEENDESKAQRKSKRLSNASYTRKSYSYINEEMEEETPLEETSNDKDEFQGKNQDKVGKTESKATNAEVKVMWRQRKKRKGKKPGKYEQKFEQINERRQAEKKARENGDEKLIVPKKGKPGKPRRIRKYTLLKDENGEKRYGCNLCSFQTETLVTINGHVLDHTGERPYVCETCGKTFKRSSNLNSHRFQHAETSVFICQLCNKGFNDRSSYKTHVKRHIGMKNHVCEECGKRFITSTDKKKHMRGHTGEKPYSCEYCTKKFRDGSSLNRHILIHTKECRFRCGLESCSRSFTRKDLCVMHIKRSHQNMGDVFVLKVDAEKPMAIQSMNDMDEVVDAISTICSDRKVEINGEFTNDISDNLTCA